MTTNKPLGTLIISTDQPAFLDDAKIYQLEHPGSQLVSLPARGIADDFFQTLYKYGHEPDIYLNADYLGFIMIFCDTTALNTDLGLCIQRKDSLYKFGVCLSMLKLRQNKVQIGIFSKQHQYKTRASCGGEYGLAHRLGLQIKKCGVACTILAPRRKLATCRQPHYSLIENGCHFQLRFKPQLILGSDFYYDFPFLPFRDLMQYVEARGTTRQ